MVGIEESRPLTHYMPSRAARESIRRARSSADSQLSWSQLNVGNTERALSVAGGAALAMLGVARRDLAGLVVAAIGGGLVYRGVTGHCHAYDALGVDTADETAKELDAQGFHVVQSTNINKPPEELYAYWRQLENLPAVMSHLQEVRAIDDRRSHWVAAAPAIAGGDVEWDAEITEDIPNRRIAWRSLPGADVDNRGAVEFVRLPGDRGTAVRVELNYRPPAGHLGKWVAKLMGEDPATQVREDLRAFKRMMEVGEMPSIDGQPHGSCRGLGSLRRG